MTKYEDLPTALGAEKAEAIIKRCEYCGEIFDTIFDEADHLLDEMEGEPFDPYYLLGDGNAVRLGNLMRTFYDYSEDPEAVRELSEEIYSILLVAEFNPKALHKELDSLLED